MRSIEIGLEVHKAIEAERRSLGEPEDHILRRLLGLAAPATDSPASSEANVGPAAWEKDGVILHHGTKLRLSYSGQTLTGEILDGDWVVNGKTYNSPSMAMVDNVVTKSGKKTNINGWNHWQVRRPGDSHYVPISILRSQAVRSA